MKAVKLFLACVIFALFGCNNSDLAPTAPEMMAPETQMSASSELSAARPIPNRNMFVSWAMQQVSVDTRARYEFKGNVSYSHVNGKDTAPIPFGRTYEKHKAAFAYLSNGGTFVDITYAHAAQYPNDPMRTLHTVRMARFEVWFQDGELVTVGGRQVLDIPVTADTRNWVVRGIRTDRTPGRTEYYFSVAR